MLAEDLTQDSASASSPSQQDINRTSRRLADLRDAELFVLFVRLLETLPEARRPGLVREQEQWMQERERQAQSAVQSAGGSLADAERSDAARERTEERIRELASRLSSLNQRQPKQGGTLP